MSDSQLLFEKLRKELLRYTSPLRLEAVSHDPEMGFKDFKCCLAFRFILQSCVGDELQSAFKALASVISNSRNPDLRNALKKCNIGKKNNCKKIIQFEKEGTEPPYFSQALIDDVRHVLEIKKSFFETFYV